MIPEQPDETGLQTLELFAQAPRFNQWMFEAVASACQGELLEIGSGIGNMSRLLLRTGLPATLSDLRQTYCDGLQNEFRSFPNFKGVQCIDLSVKDIKNAYQGLISRFDTIIALNVIEHIRDDVQAIGNSFQLLKPGGNLVILVPAFNGLYTGLDKELGHFRRYTRASVTALVKNAGFGVQSSRYFNVTGMPGWLLTGGLLRRKVIPRWQLRLYDQLVPLLRLIDRPFRKIAGLSVIIHAKKPET